MDDGGGAFGAAARYTAAGLITSVRDGKAVVHHRTALGSLPLGTPHDPDAQRLTDPANPASRRHPRHL